MLYALERVAWARYANGVAAHQRCRQAMQQLQEPDDRPRARPPALALAFDAAGRRAGGVIGAACVLWLLWHVERRAAPGREGEEWRAIATSVAQSQARQPGRAVRLGIPLPELAGRTSTF